MTAPGNLEVEVKFWVSNLAALEERLLARGAILLHPRCLERNYRFDTPTGDLSRRHQVLRLRQDSAATLTYKGAPAADSPATVREEIEVEVAEFHPARQILESLGFSVSWIYEKYRTTYAWGGLLVMLDQLPFGDFVELEGQDTAQLESAAGSLRLNWAARILESYSQMFWRFRELAVLVDHLTFDTWPEDAPGPAALSYSPADSA